MSRKKELVRSYYPVFGSLARKCSVVFTLFIVFGLLASHQCAAQAVPDTSLNNLIGDTLHQKKAGPDVQIITHRPAPGADTTSMIVEKKGPFQPNPKKAGLYSALVPGLGQLYNRNYWKVPVVYVGIGVAGYFILRNLDSFQVFRKAYIGRINNAYPTDKYVGVYTNSQLQQLQNDYNKYLDMTILFSTVGYALQVIDAITSAHLKNFDISRDISMRVRPVGTQTGVGLGLVMNFR